MKVFVNNISILQYAVKKADDSKATEKAVALLVAFLKKTVGKENRINCGKNIFVGLKNQAKGSESIEIRLDEDLYILGDSERAVFYAVTEFLERYLGWRFYSGEDEVNVLTDDVYLTPFTYKHTPKFSLRHNYAYRCFDKMTKYKQKDNFLFNYEYYPKDFIAFNSVNGWGHSYFQYIAPNKYFQSNPEYFSMNEKGEREQNGQLCLTNEEVFDITLSKMLEELRTSPYCEFVNFSQNDNGKYCRCSKCQEVYEKYQSTAATNLLFVNRLAEKIRKEFPKTNVMTFAYQYTEKPPVGIEVPKNVYIFEAVMNKCLEHKLTDKTCRFNPNMLQYIYDWSKLTKNVFLWTYTTDFSQYALGTPKLIRIMYEDFQVYKKLGVKGVFFQNNCDNALAFTNLFGYLAARLNWNTELTYVEYIELLKEYLQTHYGKGWFYVFEYLNLTCEQPISTHCYNPYQTAEMSVPYDKLPDGSYDKTYIKSAKALLDKAYKEADSKKYKKNVDLCRLSFDWYLAEITHEEELAKNPEKVKQANIKLYKKLKKHNITVIAENVCLAKEEDIDFLTKPHTWERK